ncbi:MBL fold metallo-hydrolase [Bizionia paragorgiae]|uniref:Glyoxylase, beta-lactamase superfamily II n=1 Tax=Bizionia paragorgiae TaxID=283786 RepID=A0A1H4AD26_BIZPA|nr:rhodanese-like domain-containing protein [Bizionia paragorgiae]SEA33810.1 Glyoxylase, beta-lactamase superfamily II [Bizionia paragorgiae]
MKIKQFEYKPLAHYSYAIVSNGEMAIIDPERNPKEYYAFAEAYSAKIKAVIETHPHADFVSSHLQIHKETGATIYNSAKLGADYKHTAFDDGDRLTIGAISLTAINTPGHSPDSITIMAQADDDIALFTGDTLFIGDVGRPDLRENVGNTKAKREALAEMMYHTMTTKFNEIPDHAVVYPAHGAGSLCGKNLSDANSSTLGNERLGNWAFKKQSKEEFMATLLDGQPFIPSYFGFNVDINKKGADNLEPAIASVPFKNKTATDGIIVDVRNEADFKKGHLKGSINIQGLSKDAKFETWLGAIIEPKEPFTLVIDHEKNKEELLHRVSKIGYEKQLKAVITLDNINLETTPILDIDHFKNNKELYTIVDIRNTSEIENEHYFDQALAHPLNNLRHTADTIPTNKPIVVHCAGGYRSAAGSSILQKKLNGVNIYDLSDAINKFK